jgi:hypothetical protein
MLDYLTDAQNDIKIYFETHDIPTYFYKCFFGELIKVFGITLLIPDDDCSYREQLSLGLNYLGGTGGWYEALSTSCDQCGIMDIYDDYRHFCWLRSDIFDGYIADKMIEVLFDDSNDQDYYRFKMNEVNNND